MSFNPSCNLILHKTSVSASVCFQYFAFSNESQTWYLYFPIFNVNIPFLQSQWDNTWHETMWWDKRGCCYPLNVFIQEGERGREYKKRCTSAVAHTSFSMYSAHSSKSNILQSQSTVPARRASHQHGASTWPCPMPGPLAWVNKLSYKNNMGVTWPKRNLVIHAGVQWTYRNLWPIWW